MRHKQIGGCSAYADKEEAIKREKAIKNYKTGYDFRLFAEEKPREKLNRLFLELYNNGLYDSEIAKELKISASLVSIYRRDLDLESNHNKKISLLAQAKNNKNKKSQVQSTTKRRKNQ